MGRIENWSKEFENSKEEDFRTPPFILRFIESRYGLIEHDVACFADGSNAVANPVRLESCWPVGHVYANPPFDSSSIEKWWIACMAHATSGKGKATMLLPNKLCQVFLNKWVPTCSEVILLGGRLNFHGPFSAKGGASRQGSVIIHFEVGGNPSREPKLSVRRIKTLKEWFQ